MISLKFVQIKSEYPPDPNPPPKSFPTWHQQPPVVSEMTRRHIMPNTTDHNHRILNRIAHEALLTQRLRLRVIGHESLHSHVRLEHVVDESIAVILPLAR